MATRIRLQRHGKKNYAFFHIVVADSRAKRDGRFIQKLGIYNPNTDPATIDIDFDATLDWVQKGAMPTDTTRAILSYKGVLMKKHLLDGVKKGALTEEQAEEKFAKWMEEKNSKIEGKRENLGKSAAEQAAKKLEAEAEVSKKRQEALAAKQAEAEAANAEPTEEEAPAEEAAAEGEKSNEEKAE